MPDITLFGWFHTGIAILALVSGAYALLKFKIIRSDTASGAAYLACTVLAAASALGIYKHGGFGVAHGLAVLTLLAVFVGAVAEKSALFGSLASYLQAIAYTATLLFHMIPAITDGLMRLPVDSPIVTNIEDPLLRVFYLAFLLTYVVGISLQIRWLRKRDEL